LSALIHKKVRNVYPLFCDCCGDIVKVVYPCKFTFHDGSAYDFNICPDCMDNGILEINLKRKRLVAQILLQACAHPEARSPE
jgi:hypothetical protein